MNELNTRDRLKREKEFHNEAFATGKRKKVKKYYKTTDLSKNFYIDLIHNDVKGKRVLEYGCGPGSQAFSLARNGAEVFAIDISDVAIEQAKHLAADQHLNIDFRVMDAENLQFEEQMFDIVCGSGILHHLDLPSCFSELNRVLKPEGKGVFFEPLGHNPVINLYRKITPGLRTDDEHPLLMEDLKLAESYFQKVNSYYFHLTSLVASFIPSVKIQTSFAKILNRFDSKIFTAAPSLKKYAWITVLEVNKRKDELI